MRLKSSQRHRINYKLGSLYAVITALLLSTQEPFSFLAAKRLNVTQFVFLTQVALLISLPLLILRRRSRRDLIALLGDVSNYAKLSVLFAVGMSGLLLFKLALSNAHPIIISAVINLQPFWAALAALLIARVPIPVSPLQHFDRAAAGKGQKRQRDAAQGHDGNGVDSPLPDKNDDRP
jgi:drug/metabolite transporter (DMT)-like permease